jgi:hypothetical protein
MISVTRIVVTVEALLLVVGKASTHPVKVDQYQEVFDFLYWGHVCKIHLPVHGREAFPGLVHGKGRGPNIGVRICMLTDTAGLGDLFKVLYVFC